MYIYIYIYVYVCMYVCILEISYLNLTAKSPVTALGVRGVFWLGGCHSISTKYRSPVACTRTVSICLIAEKREEKRGD
jgi:hypothetical protein